MPRPCVADPDWVTKPELARELGVTVRRIGQLLDERILPPARADGLFDVELAARRFAMFRDRDTEWESFLTGPLAELTHASGRAMERLKRPSATLDDCREASLAVQAAAVGLRFFAACRLPESLRGMHIDLHDRQEDEGLAEILRRTVEIIAAQEGTTPQTVLDRWRKEAA